MHLLYPYEAGYLYFLQADSATAKHKELKGEDKNLVLAAAHIEDAKTGRYIDISYVLKPVYVRMLYIGGGTRRAEGAMPPPPRPDFKI